MLARRRQRLHKRARGLAEASAFTRHRLRIAAKKSRYATEFYPIFLGSRQTSENWMLAGSQDTAMRANKIWKQILEEYEAPPIDVAVQEALKSFVERRRRELTGVELYS